MNKQCEGCPKCGSDNRKTIKTVLDSVDILRLDKDEETIFYQCEDCGCKFQEHWTITRTYDGTEYEDFAEQTESYP